MTGFLWQKDILCGKGQLMVLFKRGPPLIKSERKAGRAVMAVRCQFEWAFNGPRTPQELDQYLVGHYTPSPTFRDITSQSTFFIQHQSIILHLYSGKHVYLASITTKRFTPRFVIYFSFGKQKFSPLSAMARFSRHVPLKCNLFTWPK